MPLAGETIIVGAVPGERIATTVESSESAGTSGTEIEVSSVTASLVIGRIYKLVFDGSVRSETGGDRGLVRIREDTLAGDQRQAKNVHVESAGTSIGYPFHLEFEHSATATGAKTFVGTLAISGTGDGFLRAAPPQPAYMYVDYVRDA